MPVTGNFDSRALHRPCQDFTRTALQSTAPLSHTGQASVMTSAVLVPRSCLSFSSRGWIPPPQVSCKSHSTLVHASWKTWTDTFIT